MNWHVNIPVHAHERAKARFPGEEFDPQTEVNEALQAGRVSTTRPIASNGSHPDTLYAWTEDRRRVYAIKPDVFTKGDQWAVVTVLRPTERQLAGWAVWAAR